MGIGSVSIPFNIILNIFIQSYKDGHPMLDMSEKELAEGAFHILVEHPSIPEPEIFIGKREAKDRMVRIQSCGGMGTTEVPQLRIIECHEAMEALLLDCGGANCSQKARGWDEQTGS